MKTIDERLEERINKYCRSESFWLLCEPCRRIVREKLQLVIEEFKQNETEETKE